MSASDNTATHALEALGEALQSERNSSAEAFAIAADYARAIRLAMACLCYEAAAGSDVSRDLTAVSRLLEHHTIWLEATLKECKQRADSGAYSVLAPNTADATSVSIIH
jgi:hypothetical protein